MTEKKLRDRLDKETIHKFLHSALNGVRYRIDAAESLKDYEAALAAIIAHMEGVFDSFVWREVDKVYETRYDCCIARG